MTLKVEEIYKFIDKFENSNYHIASIAAMTGTGKSTVIPTAFYLRGKTIIVVQPTIAASVGIAKHLKKSIPSCDIGTAAEGEVNYNNEILYASDTKTTPLVYCTAGHLRNIMLKYAENPEIFNKPFVDYIFLDEAHTGDLQYDLIMYLFSYLYSKLDSSRLPRLMLVTATPGVYPFNPKSILKQTYPGKSYPVEITYHDRDYVNLKGRDYEKLFEDLIEVVSKDHQEMLVPEDESDGWLVFCPGKNEINNVVEGLKKKTQGSIIIPLYSSMTEDSIDYEMVPPPGMRKIIVSTNVAEASITIEGLSRVYDTLVEKSTTESKNGGTMLTTVNISKASAAQRKGRAGRTKPGSCYRMCTEKYFETLNEVRKREIERIAPDGMILDLLSRKLQVKDIISDNVISKQKLKETTDRLENIGLIKDSEVTEAGKWVKNTSLSPRVGMFLWVWGKFSRYNPFVGSLIASILETHAGGYFYIDENGPTITSILQDKFPVLVQKIRKDPIKTSFRFNLYLILDILSNFKTLDVSPQILKTFCRERSLNNQRIKETIKLTKKLTMKFYNGNQITIGNFDVNYEIKKALPILHQCYSDLVFKSDNKKYRNKWEFEYPFHHINVIPLSTFDTGFKTIVSMYESYDKIDYIKIS